MRYQCVVIIPVYFFCYLKVRRFSVFFSDMGLITLCTILMSVSINEKTKADTLPRGMAVC